MSSGSWKRPAKAGSAPSTQTENSPRDGAAGSSPVSTKSPRGIGGGKSPRFSLLGNKDKEPAPSPTMPASRLSKSAIELIEELGKGGASPGSAIAHEEESDDEPEESSDEVREREMKKKDAMKPPRKPLPSLPIAQTSGDNAEDQDEEEIVVYE